MILDDIGSHLTLSGVGSVGTTIFLSELPSDPDTCLVVQEYGGSAPELTHDGAKYENPRLQIMARSTSYVSARALADSAFRSLIAHNVALGSSRYLSITPLQSPFGMGRDQNNRLLVGFNVEIMKVLE